MTIVNEPEIEHVPSIVRQNDLWFSDGAGHEWFLARGFSTSGPAPFTVFGDTLTADGIELVRVWHTAAHVDRVASPTQASNVTIVIQIEGNSELRTGTTQRVHSLVPGSVVVARSNEQLSLVSNGPTARIEIHLAELYPSVVALRPDEAVAVDPSSVYFPVLVAATNAVLGSSSEMTPSSFLYLRSAISNLGAALVTELFPAPWTGANRRYPDRLIRAREAIKREAPRSDFNATELARIVNISPRHLSRTFVDAGSSVKEEIRRERLRIADELTAGRTNLRQDQLAEIAYLSGYSSPRALRHATLHD